jgi:hypothetical protein
MITQSVLGSGSAHQQSAKNLGLVDFQTPSWNGAIVNTWRIDRGDRCFVRLTPSAIAAGLGSVTGTVSGVTGSLQNGSLNGGSIGTPLSGLSG